MEHQVLPCASLLLCLFRSYLSLYLSVPPFFYLSICPSIFIYSVCVCVCGCVSGLQSRIQRLEGTIATLQQVACMLLRLTLLMLLASPVHRPTLSSHQAPLSELNASVHLRGRLNTERDVSCHHVNKLFPRGRQQEAHAAEGPGAGACSGQGSLPYCQLPT